MNRYHLSIVFAALLTTWGCGSTATADPAEPGKTPQKRAVILKGSKSKWVVGEQLIQGLPWGNENESEASLLKDVKEAEATPDNRLVLALTDLAAWYRGHKRFDDAEKTYQRALTNPYANRVVIQNNLGVLYTEAGRHPEAETAFQFVMNVWKGETTVQDRWNNWAESCHNYGFLLGRMGRADEAAKMEAKADEIMAKRRAWLDSIGK
jgi:tetratricopeptide (TPR) repeat protein